MPQVNMSINDEHYAILVKEAARRQLESGKIVKIASVAYELLRPEIAKLNGQAPSEDDIQDTNPDDKQERSQLASAFDNIDI